MTNCQDRGKNKKLTYVSFQSIISDKLNNLDNGHCTSQINKKWHLFKTVWKNSKKVHDVCQETRAKSLL